MEILRVYPKELHVRLELSGTELNMLLDFLDNSVVEPTSATERSVEFVNKELFPQLESLSQQIASMK